MEASLYERDYYAWVQQQVSYLQQQKFDELDLANLIEEVDDLGRADKKAIKSNLTVLLVHLLKYKYQPIMVTSSWRNTIVEHRRRILNDLKDSPSLKPFLDNIFDQVYEDARVDAAFETQMPFETFPAACPFDREQVLDPTFLPPAQGAGTLVVETRFQEE